MEEDMYRVMGPLKAENIPQVVNVDASLPANSPIHAVAEVLCKLCDHGYLHPVFTIDPVVVRVDAVQVA